MKLRNEFETDIEKMLREELESRGLENGVDFTCQFPIRYGHIIDIAFTEQKIAVEADGEPWHTPQKDAIKTGVLTKIGWKVLRFPGNDIYEDAAKCVDKIMKYI